MTKEKLAQFESTRLIKSGTDTVELIDFAQDRCKRHGQTAFR